MGSLGLAPIQPQTGVDPLGGYTRQTLIDRAVSGEVPVHCQSPGTPYCIIA
jgi:hypothetical protein